MLHPDVSTSKGPPGLDVSTLLRPVLNLDVLTPQGPELNLDLSGQHELVLFLNETTPQGPELHLNVTCLTTEICAAPGLV